MLMVIKLESGIFDLDVLLSSASYLLSGYCGFMGYGDLFLPGSFIINPCFDLWGFMGKIRVI